MVKVRIKFQKYGAMKFIGHLDVMRYFQKAFRRADIDNEYTKGFSPHQIMSFAAPLGVGLTSDGEYVDVQLLSMDSPERMINRMNAVLTEGFRITGFHVLKEREENQKAVTAMSQVASADYLVSLKDGYTISDTITSVPEFKAAFEKFLENQEIVVDKKTKTSERAVDIRPMITMTAYAATEYKEKRKSFVKPVNSEAPDAAGEKNQTLSVAEVYENGIQVYMQLNTGSAENLKPELVMEAFFDALGITFNKFAWQVHRIELYAKADDGSLISLNDSER